ncbi:MAG: RNA methyltransferase [Candidatus Pacebacteria bacterium]|nr:RNA methyltransferase [Candidatus Paceibacterota bacterium]
MTYINKLQPIKITSKDNPKIKTLRKLGQKKYRDENNKFLVENAVITYDAAKTGVIFDTIFVTKDFIEKNREIFDFIINKSKTKEYYLIDEKINRSFSSLSTASGIATVYSKIENKIDYSGPIIYLNALSDPGNLGTILRSALAFDLKNIIIDEHSANVYNPKTISAAKDAIFKLNIEFDQNLKILKEIKKKMPVFTTRLERSEGLNLLKKQKIFCVIFGSESHGVEQKIQELSNNFIKIPISNKIESLNVATSAGIIFYEIYSHNQ